MAKAKRRTRTNAPTQSPATGVVLATALDRRLTNAPPEGAPLDAGEMRRLRHLCADMRARVQDGGDIANMLESLGEAADIAARLGYVKPPVRIETIECGDEAWPARLRDDRPDIERAHWLALAHPGEGSGTRRLFLLETAEAEIPCDGYASAVSEYLGCWMRDADARLADEQAAEPARRARTTGGKRLQIDKLSGLVWLDGVQHGPIQSARALHMLIKMDNAKGARVALDSGRWRDITDRLPKPISDIIETTGGPGGGGRLTIF